MPSGKEVSAVLGHIDLHLSSSVERLFALLRIPSVSSHPDRAANCAQAASWLCDTLAAMGLAARVCATAGHPVVVAQHRCGGIGPRVLFYGHYDVQPAEPLELWTYPPFEPRLIDGPHGKRITARGAVDDKGQVLMFLEALRAWKEAGSGIPVEVTVLLEGEEEVGSPNLEPFLRANRDLLSADTVLISDTGMWDIDTPAITTRLRGLAYVQLTLKGPTRDLHSGLFGGSALNPVNALTCILGALHDANGRVQVPAFYDDVRELPPEQVREWDALGFDEQAFLNAIGLSDPAGERDRPPLQRLWARPTADINGIWGGYTGPGAKTIIPAEASAKLSFRLVPDQDPEAIFAGLKRFVAERLPGDARVEYEVFTGAPAIAVPTDTPWVRAARAALMEEYGRSPVMMGCGGSIPVVDAIKRVLGLDSVLMGFGLDGDQVHSPNEKFELRCFHHGIRSHARLLGHLAGVA